MVGKNRGNPKREREDTLGVGSTAVELSTAGAGAPPVAMPNQPPSSDTGTPLPDDPSVLKEDVKGLKSQLRRHKRKVLPHHLISAYPRGLIP